MRKWNMVATLLFLASALCQAEGSSIENKAIELIKNTAELICGDYQVSGSSSETEITGKAKAELRGLAKQLADLGIQGAANLDVEKYEGVLRRELHKELADVRRCRLIVWRDLSDRLLGLGVSETPPESTPTEGDLPNLKEQQLALLQCIAENDFPVFDDTIQKCDVGDMSTTKRRYVAVSLFEKKYLYCKYSQKNGARRTLTMGPWNGQHYCEITASGAEILVKEGRL